MRPFCPNVEIIWVTAVVALGFQIHGFQSFSFHLIRLSMALTLNIMQIILILPLSNILLYYIYLTICSQCMSFRSFYLFHGEIHNSNVLFYCSWLWTSSKSIGSGTSFQNLMSSKEPMKPMEAMLTQPLKWSSRIRHYIVYSTPSVIVSS